MKKKPSCCKTWLVLGSLSPHNASGHRGQQKVHRQQQTVVRPPQGRLGRRGLRHHRDLPPESRQWSECLGLIPLIKSEANLDEGVWLSHHKTKKVRKWAKEGEFRGVTTTADTSEASGWPRFFPRRRRHRRSKQQEEGGKHTETMLKVCKYYGRPWTARKPLWAKVLEECRRIRLFVVVAVTAATG